MITACRIRVHRWGQTSSGSWQCQRCRRVAPDCDNCGGQHNPNKIVICSVTRDWSR